MKVGLAWMTGGLASVCISLTCSLAAEPDIHVFDIPEGNAEDAIAAFSQQAQRMISAPGDALLNVRVPSLYGQFTPACALAIILKNTDLQIASDDGRIIVLKRRAAPRVPPPIDNASRISRDDVEMITVTGYRASLKSSTITKRQAITFADFLFAEDIGKFPDTNAAEAFNRISGITITREVTGEGLNVSIRGLGTNFTKVLLNNAPVAVASTGRTDAQNANREVDLNMFPVELFSYLSVSKSPTAGLIEGGAAGTINMRSARPFDHVGFRLNYSAQGQINSASGKLGLNDTLVVSNTWHDKFGVLIGVSAHHNLVRTQGGETIGWTNPNLSAAQCGAAGGCNTTGGGNWTIPAIAPTNASTRSLGIAGDVIDQAWLLAHNPKLSSISQLDNGLLPRLARPADQAGSRDRFNAVASLEYWPQPETHIYLDTVFGRTVNRGLRTDMAFQVRNGAVIPLDEEVDVNGIVVSGTFANANMFLELRPFVEKGDFASLNPGLEWQASELLRVNLQANVTRSHFFRDYPTVGLFTQPTTVSYSFRDGKIPAFASSVDPNDVHSWGWVGERGSVAQEKRYTYTNGAHFDVAYGAEKISAKAGLSYDDIYRSIRAADNSLAWQAALCGNNPSTWLPNPNTQPTCDGTDGNADPVYPGYGTGYTSGAPPLVWRGSLVPNTDVYRYLLPGPQGYATINWDAFKRASNYASYASNAPFTNTSITGTKSGTVSEKIVGIYLQLDGVLGIANRDLDYDIGVRWVETHQTIGGLSYNRDDPRNASLSDGGLYPATPIFANFKHAYQAFLPSVNFVYHPAKDIHLRFSASRTMTRPDPSAMLPGANFSSASADIAAVGNSALNPYYSTNVDAGLEYYTGEEGYVGLAAFRKSVSGFTVTGTTTHPFSDLAVYGINYTTLNDTQRTAIDRRGGPAQATVVFNQETNADGLLTVSGFEANWVQPLDQLLEPYGLKGFGFTANATFIHQTGHGAAPAVAIGVPTYSYNLVGYYENNGAMLRLSYVYYDRTVASSTNQNSIAAARLYGDPYGQLDFSASYKLSNLFGRLPSDPEITLAVQNLMEATQRSYFQFTRATYSYYKPGNSLLFGVRGTF